MSESASAAPDGAEAPILGPDGQPISKNQLKKLQKAKEVAEKKAAKAAQKAETDANAPAAKPKLGGDNDEELDPTKYLENRMNTIANFQVRRTDSVWILLEGRSFWLIRKNRFVSTSNHSFEFLIYVTIYISFSFHLYVMNTG